MADSTKKILTLPQYVKREEQVLVTYFGDTLASVRKAFGREDYVPGWVPYTVEAFQGGADFTNAAWKAMTDAHRTAILDTRRAKADQALVAHYAKIAA